MQIEYLVLQHFRNYDQAEICWQPGLNVLCGANAQGKSNLLEAIVYLSLAASFRHASEGELILWQQPYFYLKGRIASARDGLVVLSAAYHRQGRRRWLVNGQPRRRLAEVVGLLHTVIFSPEDLQLIKAGPALRRRFLNEQMCQLSPAFCQLLQQYNQIVKQRNYLLKQLHAASFAAAAEALAPWDQQLCAAASQIIVQRARLLARLAPLAADLHQSLAGQEELSLAYQSSLGEIPVAEAASLEVAEVAEQLRLQLEHKRPVELLRGQTLCGPHRDDLAIRIGGAEARHYASQGQQRTAVLALKLAELELAQQRRGEYPLLLLDDVLSELDALRRQRLLQLIAEKTQTFISATEPPAELAGGKVWRIAAGKILAG